MRYYIGMIHKEADSDYGVSFPDFPGAATAGTSLDDAQAMAEESLALHVDGLVEDGEALPEPSTLDAVMELPDSKGGVAIRVAVKTEAPKCIRVNVTLPEDILERIDIATLADTVYVLHAFQKKTEATLKRDVALATTRFKELMRRVKQ
jgi:predicted RNase H-like HicB family nuclease